MNRERHIIEDPTNKSDAEMEVSKHFEESLRRAKDKVQFIISLFFFCFILFMLLHFLLRSMFVLFRGGVMTPGELCIFSIFGT